MIKKLFASVISLAMAFGVCTVPTIAAEQTESATYAVTPRYTNLGSVTAGMSINSDNKAECIGSYYLYYSMNSKITVILMESTDGLTNWTAVEKWQEYNYGSGAKAHSGTSTDTLKKGYWYCSFTQVTVYNGDGSVAENAYCNSRAYECT